MTKTFGPNEFKAGLPKHKEDPVCHHCKKNKAFVLTEEPALVCGQCWLEYKKTNENAIILEAGKILQKRGINHAKQKMPTLSH